MTSLEIYLAIGAIIGFVAVCSRTEPQPASIYAITMLIVILFWPACLLGGYLQGRRR